MTREEQRKIKAEKLAAKLAAKEEKKQEKQDQKAWDKMVKMAESKGAWIADLKLFALMPFICLLLASKMSGQTDCEPSNYLSIGGGIGFSNKNALAHVQIGYKVYKGWGIDGSMIAHMDNINPAMFNGQLVKSFYNGNKRFSLLAGLSYQITTFDKTDGTKTLPIFGLEWARIMTYHDAIVYVRGQVTGDNFCLMVGLSGLFKSKNN